MVKQSTECKQKWIRPRQDDIQDVVEQQILPCEVVGEWESAVFNVQNSREIQGTFDELFSK